PPSPPAVSWPFSLTPRPGPCTMEITFRRSAWGSLARRQGRALNPSRRILGWLMTLAALGLGSGCSGGSGGGPPKAEELAAAAGPANAGSNRKARDGAPKGGEPAAAK